MDPDVFDLDAPPDTAVLVQESASHLNLQPAALDGLLSVRTQVAQLQGLLAQTLRRVALPRCREIGAELIRVQALYPRSKSGPGGRPSQFFRDAEQVTGLKRRSLEGYISVARNWGRLQDYLASQYEEGASPVVSLRGALEIIREMNKPLPALGDGDQVVDATAQTVEPAAAGDRADDRAARRAELAADYVRPAAQAAATLGALRAVRGLPLPLKDRLEAISQELKALLAEVQAALAESVEIPEQSATSLSRPATATAMVDRVIHQSADDADQWVESVDRSDEQLVPVDAVDAVTAAEPEAATAAPKPKKKRSPLADRYERSTDGLARLEHDIAAAGSRSALARELGVSPQAVFDYLRRTKAAVEAQGGV